MIVIKVDRNATKLKCLDIVTCDEKDKNAHWLSESHWYKCNICCRYDLDSDGDKIPDAQQDTDKDGILDSQDLDKDGDGLPNAWEEDPDGDGIPNWKVGWEGGQ